jgi:hypothetical protein
MKMCIDESWNYGSAAGVKDGAGLFHLLPDGGDTAIPDVDGALKQVR